MLPSHAQLELSTPQPMPQRSVSSPKTVTNSTSAWTTPQASTQSAMLSITLMPSRKNLSRIALANNLAVWQILTTMSYPILPQVAPLMPVALQDKPFFSSKLVASSNKKTWTTDKLKVFTWVALVSSLLSSLWSSLITWVPSSRTASLNGMSRLSLLEITPVSSKSPRACGSDSLNTTETKVRLKLRPSETTSGKNWRTESPNYQT